MTLELKTAPLWAALLALTATITPPPPAVAATVSEPELAALRALARQQGAAPVLIHLMPTTLTQLQQEMPRVKAEALRREAALVAELGEGAWPVGRWRNEAGQIELYLTEAGLQTLTRSNQAVNFRPGQHWSQRLNLHSADYRVVAIEKALREQGKVSLAVLPHLDQDADFELNREGQVRVSAAGQRGAQLRLAALAAQQGVEDQRAAADAAAADSHRMPGVPLRLDRQALLRLLDTTPLRALSVLGQDDPRPFSLDAEALKVAEAYGQAEVMVGLRSPLFGAARQTNAVAAQVRTHTEVFKALRAAAQVPDSVAVDLPRMGAFIARLSAAQIKALAQSQDRRILSISLNRPMGQPALATSTQTQNMAWAWNQGFRAAGQYIVVMDTGVKRDHPFFKDANGNSRVTLEACFGTTDTNYVSKCKQPDFIGDSPWGLEGSAAPVASCSSLHPKTCNHGTHVAGIAAGRNEAQAGTGVQGVAPDAKLLAVQVHSFDPNGRQTPVYYPDDLVKAVDALAKHAEGGAIKPYTVNLSLVGGYHEQPCSTGEHFYFAYAISYLKDMGIPVVAATGNNGFRGAISFPACAPNVIKVVSANNDGVGNTVSPFSNVPAPNTFPNEVFWVAPGGGGGTTVWSSIAFGAAYGTDEGTSMAAPHIAGLYAAAKAARPDWDVQAVTNYFLGNAAEKVFLEDCFSFPCPPKQTVSGYRIRLGLK